MIKSAASLRKFTETLQASGTAQLTKFKPKKYGTVNAAWPDGTNDGRDLKPTPQEALAAAKRLYRFAMKRRFRGKVKLTSGRRHTWVYSGVLYVNPDEAGGGWHEIVHSLSHYCAYYLFRHRPGQEHNNKVRPHGPQHAFLEKEMINYVIKSGWLEGKLKREPKPKKDPRLVKAERVLLGIKKWERKAKLAATKLKKLRAQRKRYAKLGVLPE